ncbi:hypothetical protein HWQ46_25415 [Shewanella sp. D64]|uniref:hypothetical protein n=1 Tax=unclassified Shewanella TaxID=196818 RepID=UPI0022BA5094|nr:MULTISPECIES: hypothetical protein [unclassified Shewanella]MEC4728858.1 hypothetical protein [Shewanella sp. D64]MEC4740732.1 hypothetical protein [Shewanella sp. E94]WBJ95309.1 hypothetical protein HWQ47_26570 [Shewanella sp. MTB7]
MKHNERLYIGNAESDCISATCYLSFRNPGTASIITDIEPKIGQIMAYECGFNGELTRWFTGYVESYRAINEQTYSIFCRELSAMMRHNMPVFLQHATLEDVLNGLNAKTGLDFVIPDKAYRVTPAPCITNHGNGYSLMDSLGAVFDIDRYVWQQQGNGTVFVGSWDDSLWANKNLPVPTSMIENASMDLATLPLIPALRPGAIVNGQRIRNIQLNKDTMVVTWMTK